MTSLLDKVVKGSIPKLEVFLNCDINYFELTDDYYSFKELF